MYIDLRISFNLAPGFNKAGKSSEICSILPNTETKRGKPVPKKTE